MLAMPRVLGYADPLSVAPGETIRFMVGTLDGPRRYRAEIVRVVRGDTDPGGPKTVRLPTPIDGEHQGTPQPLDAGSYVIVERPDAFGGLTRFTLEAIIQPTRVPVRPTARTQVIMGHWAEAACAGLAMMLDEVGALAFLGGVGAGREPARATTGVPLTARRWYEVRAVVDLAAGTVTLSQTPLVEHTPSAERPTTVDAAIPPMTPTPGGAFFLAAARRGMEDGRLRTMWHFNGKIDRP